MFARHKKLNREFPVQEINFVSKLVKCEGDVEAGICVHCDVNKPCPIPIFRFDEVDFRIEDDGNAVPKEK
jgi:hypothetical protein